MREQQDSFVDHLLVIFPISPSGSVLLFSALLVSGYPPSPLSICRLLHCALFSTRHLTPSILQLLMLRPLKNFTLPVKDLQLHLEDTNTSNGRSGSTRNLHRETQTSSCEDQSPVFLEQPNMFLQMWKFASSSFIDSLF